MQERQKQREEEKPAAPQEEEEKVGSKKPEEQTRDEIDELVDDFINEDHAQEAEERVKHREEKRGE